MGKRKKRRAAYPYTQVVVSWFLTLSGLVEGYQHFRGTFASIFREEVGKINK
jgi:hypothetical protein